MADGKGRRRHLWLDEAMLRRNKPEPEPIADLTAPSRVVQVCHPDWRGVRASAEAFGAPVLAIRDLDTAAPLVLERLRSAGTERLVIQGWPPGAAVLAAHAARSGVAVAAVSHSSLAQHGTDGGEAEAVTAVLELMRRRIVDRIGFVKRGLAEVFTAMGHRAHHLSNRLPALPAVRPRDLGAGDHIGVFLYPYWRKNVTTQVAAAMLLGATAHVMHRPAVGYLPADRIVEHGELPRARFREVLGGVGLNLHVTLSECHPMTPMESYLLGVPCLVSRTSSLFTDDADLLAMTTVAELDDPTMISVRARELRAAKDEIIPRALASLRRSDAAAKSTWDAFVA
jgi:hypothetical protein